MPPVGHAHSGWPPARSDGSLGGSGGRTGVVSGGSAVTSRPPSCARLGGPGLAGRGRDPPEMEPRTRRAAFRPLPMQAGMPTPRRAAPATATPTQTGHLLLDLATLIRWPTWYWGKARSQRVTSGVERGPADARAAAASSPKTEAAKLVVVEAEVAFVAEPAHRGSDQDVVRPGQVRPLPVQVGAPGDEGRRGHRWSRCGGPESRCPADGARMDPLATVRVMTATEAYSMVAEHAGSHRGVRREEHGGLGGGHGQHDAVDLEGSGPVGGSGGGAGAVFVAAFGPPA